MRYVAKITCLVAVSASVLPAQVSTASLELLKSSSETTRIGAFYRIVGYSASDKQFSTAVNIQRLFAAHPEERERTSLALIHLLERENAIVGSGTGPDSEEYASAYYGDLINAVASLRDVRAISALVGAIGTGNMAMNGLVNIGEAAAPAIIQVMSSGDRGARIGAAMTLGKFTTPGRASLGETTRSMVKAALLKALKDSVGSIRLQAVEALAPFRDPDLRPVMQNLAVNDPYTAKRESRQEYPVRKVASEWLTR